MAITDPQAIRFSNENIRPLANKLLDAYWAAKSAQQIYVANGYNNLYPAGGGVLIDGAAEDGRHIITSDDVRAFITLAGAFITNYEATSNANLNIVIKPSTLAE